MNILITTIVDPLNSAYSRLHAVAEYLGDRHNVSILSVRDNWKSSQSTAESYRAESSKALSRIKIEYLTDKSISIARQELLCRSLIKRILKEWDCRFDIIFDYNSISLGMTAQSLINAGAVPRVYDLADDLPDMIARTSQLNPIIARIGSMFAAHQIRRSINKANLITGTTEVLLNEFGVPQSKGIVIPNGVPREYFIPIEKEEIIESRKESGEFLIGYVGVLREWVDMDTVFKAIKIIRSEFPIRIVIIGEEGGRQRVIENAKRIGVDDNVTMLGTKPHLDVRKYLAACDMGIIPFTKSRTSNFALPLKFFEYASVGLPVVSTPIETLDRKFGEGISRYENHNQLIEVIEEIRKNPKIARKRLELIRGIIEQEYCWDAISSKLEKHLIATVSHSRISS